MVFIYKPGTGAPFRAFRKEGQILKIGYPCKNNTLPCTASGTFRLRSYSGQKLTETVKNNLNCLERILRYNVDHGIFFFRISSDTVPFASHKICDLDWEDTFSVELRKLGNFIKARGIRISMHPDQFIVLNSPRENVLKNSVAELEYHAAFLDALRLGPSAKIQIHVGGVYGDKALAKKRFVSNYSSLSDEVKKRLVLENDDRLYCLGDCLDIYKKTGIPVLFDSFHHWCLNRGEPLGHAALLASHTWREKDGAMMTDFSHQKKGKAKGAHADSIDIRIFAKYINEVEKFSPDIMLEIKDKEKSAIKALTYLSKRASPDNN